MAPEARKERSCQSFSASHIGPRAECPFHRPMYKRPGFALSENREMEREPHCRFCKKSLISGKRINTVPVFGVSRNKTLLLDSGQDSVVLAQSFESLRFSLEQGESFSDLSCLT